VAQKSSPQRQRSTKVQSLNLFGQLRFASFCKHALKVRCQFRQNGNKPLWFTCRHRIFSTLPVGMIRAKLIEKRDEHRPRAVR
jgi:hypothetical protein